MLAFLSLFLWLPAAKAFVSDPTNCHWSCHQALAEFLFKPNTLEDDFYASHCQNELRAKSYFLCMRHYCTPEQADYGWHYWNSQCEEYGEVSLLPWSIIDNITWDQAHRVMTVDEFWFSRTEESEENPIVLDQLTQVPPEVYHITHKTEVGPLYRTVFALDIWLTALKDIYLSTDITQEWYGWAMVGYWGLVMSLGILYRFYLLVAQVIQQRRKDNGSSSSPAWLLRYKMWMRRWITTPALLGYHSAQPFGWCTIPPRLQSLLVILWVIINVILCCIDYHPFGDYFFYRSTARQIWQWLSDRTGIMATANMPLMFTFAMRNNVLLWLTGWSFTTYSQFHRWVARVATVQAILHSVGYTVLDFLDEGWPEYKTDWQQRYWWMGNIATIAMSLLCVFSIYPMRKHIYEVFLIVHIIGALLFLIGMYYHVEIFGDDYMMYIWPCVAVWSFDRFLRLCRLIFLNFPACKGTASYHPDSNMIRLSVPTRFTIQPQPGTYFYIYMLNGLKFWESHPFTLSTWTEKRASSRELSFAIRPHDSFTKRMMVQLAGKSEEVGNQNIVQPVRVLLEGPYGSGHTFAQHDKVLIIVGGSGITVALAHLSGLADAIVRSAPHRIQRIHIVWAVRSHAQFQDVLVTELAQWLQAPGALSTLDVEIDIYITGSEIGNSPGDVTPPDLPIEEANLKEVGIGVDKAIDAVDAYTKKISSPSPDMTEQVKIFPGRPSVRKVIDAEIQAHCFKGVKMAVLCCGPGLLADDARAAVVTCMGHTEGDLEFFAEAFNW
ncbi:hypothetical protein Z517_10071 [Fonsecaea pedrosoi CBS 271.37]|uniref:FAD-binding FR-type domain-containing protein n=1 Tax=Fonsecaea pedrosoi CBS 271.37 TaxID=1442368 RepID=A0A0D2G940_9EURO|nr:uncharacterized protein Z517_10071 [Fonsecaea pedrosoi CBS 271.37]KIW75330.1 hypothetical protein Z517_10071 [Fonsecaea pedrosoi CBS 271.37]